MHPLEYLRYEQSGSNEARYPQHDHTTFKKDYLPCYRPRDQTCYEACSTQDSYDTKDIGYFHVNLLSLVDYRTRCLEQSSQQSLCPQDEAYPLMSPQTPFNRTCKHYIPLPYPLGRLLFYPLVCPVLVPPVLPIRNISCTLEDHNHYRDMFQPQDIFSRIDDTSYTLLAHPQCLLSTM